MVGTYGEDCRTAYTGPDKKKVLCKNNNETPEGLWTELFWKKKKKIKKKSTNQHLGFELGLTSAFGCISIYKLILRVYFLVFLFHAVTAISMHPSMSS